MSFQFFTVNLHGWSAVTFWVYIYFKIKSNGQYWPLTCSNIVCGIHVVLIHTTDADSYVTRRDSVEISDTVYR